MKLELWNFSLNSRRVIRCSPTGNFRAFQNLGMLYDKWTDLDEVVLRGVARCLVALLRRRGGPGTTMTFTIHNVIAILRWHSGNKNPVVFLLRNFNGWPQWQRSLYNYLLGIHLAHVVEFAVSFFYYLVFWPSTFAEAHSWHWGWVAKVVAFNLACEFIFYGFWHYLTYASHYARGPLKERKYNKSNPSGQLQYEIFYTTLGWLHSAAVQIVCMHLWASGKLSYYPDFWAYPAYSITYLLFITWWRDLHFYWIHRAMHPWWNVKYGLKEGDIGAVLYRYVHSLHHKSYNPGPWSGLSMHPIEHLLYYTCAWIPLLLTAHPMHFLYAKFHCDISPIGGHDGFDEPAGGGAQHYLHHAKYECNYAGNPDLAPFDKIFGTWVDYEDFKKAGSIKGAKELAANRKSKSS